MAAEEVPLVSEGQDKALKLEVAVEVAEVVTVMKEAVVVVEDLTIQIVIQAVEEEEAVVGAVEEEEGEVAEEAVIEDLKTRISSTVR